MPGPTLVQPPSIKLNGGAVSDAVYDQLVELRVEQSVSLPSRLTLRMSDPDFQLVDGSLFDIGTEVTVAFPDERGTSVTVFDGEIVSVGCDQMAEALDGCEMVITAFDRSHRLGHDSVIRAFQKQSYGELVRKIASESGLRADVHSDASRTKFDYIIQTTTNFAFLNEMAFRLGHQWNVTGQTLKFGPRADSSPIELDYLEDLRRFKARFGAADRTTSVTVQGWDAKSQKEIVGTESSVLGSPDPTTVGNATIGSNGRSKSRAFAGKLISSTLAPDSTAEAQALAKALGTRLATSELSARGEAIGRPTIKAGSRVSIKGMGSKLSGVYYITTVEHIFGRNTDLITRFTAGGTEPSSIVDLLGAGDDRIAPFGRLGLSIALVTNNKDPDGIGRVKVKFPTLSGEVESAWARIVSAGAGSSTGLMVVPQIDDEVLVGFEHGDLRRPYVLGGLWSTKKKPPTGSDVFLDSNKVVQWGMTTAAGHSLLLREGSSPDKKHFKVTLSDKKTTLLLGEDKIEIVANDGKPIELKNGKASIVLAANGDITIKGANVTIEAQQALKATGLPVEVKSSTMLKVEASTSLELKANASAKLESSGITEVKGSMVKVN